MKRKEGKTGEDAPGREGGQAKVSYGDDRARGSSIYRWKRGGGGYDNNREPEKQIKERGARKEEAEVISRCFRMRQRKQRFLISKLPSGIC